MTIKSTHYATRNKYIRQIPCSVRRDRRKNNLSVKQKLKLSQRQLLRAPTTLRRKNIILLCFYLNRK